MLGTTAGFLSWWDGVDSLVESTYFAGAMRESLNIARCEYRPKQARKRRDQPELKCGRIVTAKPPKRLRGPVVCLKYQTLAAEEAPPRSAIVEPKRPKGMLAHLLLDDSPEAHQKRGDAADALFREIARRVAASKRE
jgi:hypothetical protein